VLLTGKSSIGRKTTYKIRQQHIQKAATDFAKLSHSAIASSRDAQFSPVCGRMCLFFSLLTYEDDEETYRERSLTHSISGEDVMQVNLPGGARSDDR